MKLFKLMFIWAGMEKSGARPSNNCANFCYLFMAYTENLTNCISHLGSLCAIIIIHKRPLLSQSKQMGLNINLSLYNIVHFYHSSFLLLPNTMLQRDCHIWATSRENLFLQYANNKGADQSAHPWCLISLFVVHCLDSLIPLLSKFKISRLYLVSEARRLVWVLPGCKPRRQVFSWHGSL